MFLRKFSYPTKLIKTCYTVEKRQKIFYAFELCELHGQSHRMHVHYVALTLFIHYVIEINKSVRKYLNGRDQRIGGHSTRSSWSVFYNEFIGGERTKKQTFSLVNV